MRAAVAIYTLAFGMLISPLPAMAGEAGGAAQHRAENPHGLVVAHQRVEGEITAIDHANGRVSIESHGEQLNVMLPPATIANFKKGDRVVVGTEMAMAEQGLPHGSATSGTKGFHAAFSGEHTVSGTIKGLDKSTGTLSLDTRGETLSLQFPKEAVQGLQNGDRATVMLAIRKGGEEPGSMSGTSAR
jgi:predicted RecA/RadA family phage recombinase